MSVCTVLTHHTHTHTHSFHLYYSLLYRYETHNLVSTNKYCKTKFSTAAADVRRELRDSISVSPIAMFCNNAAHAAGPAGGDSTTMPMPMPMNMPMNMTKEACVEYLRDSVADRAAYIWPDLRKFVNQGNTPMLKYESSSRNHKVMCKVPRATDVPGVTFYNK
jgi:hypothetical protein